MSYIHSFQIPEVSRLLLALVAHGYVPMHRWPGYWFIRGVIPFFHPHLTVTHLFTRSRAPEDPCYATYILFFNSTMIRLTISYWSLCSSMASLSSSPQISPCSIHLTLQDFEATIIQYGSNHRGLLRTVDSCLLLDLSTDASLAIFWRVT